MDEPTSSLSQSEVQVLFKIMRELNAQGISIVYISHRLEEIMEIATWRQLYQHEKPMIILNINGFYDPLIAHLNHTTEQGFMKQQDLERLVVCNYIDEAIDLLNQYVHIDDPVATHKI